MYELKQTETFRTWRERLKDQRARALIASRLDRLAYGHVGDVEPVGEGVSELRMHHGPGYRIVSCGAVNTSLCCCVGAIRAARRRTSRLRGV